jgi:hypothetical protein
MMKKLIITIILMLIVGFGVVYLTKIDMANTTGFNVGDQVMVKNTDNCNCIVENTWRYTVSIVCSGHTGVSHETVNPKILELCEEDKKF